MKRWGVLVVGVVVAVVAAIVLWPSDEDPPAPAAPRAPLLRPLEIKSLWQGPTDVQDVEDNADAVLFQHGDSNLTLVDATTGATRWTFEKAHDLGGVGKMRTFNGGPDERHLVADGVLVEYDYTADCQYPENPPRGRGNCRSGPDDESGLVLVSAKDGSVVWRTPVITAFPAADTPIESRPEQILRVANDQVAVVTVTNGMVHPDYAGGTQRTVAIDVPTGKVLWDKPDGVWPMYIVGDTLLGVVSGTLPGTGTVVATDLATGEKRWDRATAGLVTVAGDVALVHADEKFTVVKAGTGSEVATFNSAATTCRSDRSTVIACVEPLDETGMHHRVRAYAVKTGKTTTAAKDVADLDAVWDGGRIVVRERTASAFRLYTVDTNGTVIDKDLDWPGEIVAFTGTRTVIAPDREEPVEVYEVLS